MIDKIVVPGLRDEFQLSPAVYYRRQKECFEGGAAAFEKESQCEVGRLQRELQATEESLMRRNEVLAEVMEEFIRTKKSGLR